jgi:hypothetical protein
MERQMNNTESVRMPTLPELFDDNKNSLLLPQAHVNNRFSNSLTPNKPKPMPFNKRLRHQLLFNSDATMNNLAPTKYVQGTSSGTLNVTALKSTTLHKTT